MGNIAPDMLDGVLKCKQSKSENTRSKPVTAFTNTSLTTKPGKLAKSCLQSRLTFAKRRGFNRFF